MAQSATTQAGLDASVSAFIKTVLDDATSAEMCKTLGVAAPDGWVDDSSETWAYVSADSPTFVFSVNADVTTKYSVGQRIKLTQTTVKYFIITAVGTYGSGVTNITVYGGTDYTLANAAISANFHSSLKAPFGFPLDKAKWTVEVTTSTNTSKSSPSASTWYGGSGVSPTGPSIDIPIGSWEVYYTCTFGLANNAATSAEASVTLSTANNSESDSTMTCYHLEQNSGSTITGFRLPGTRTRFLTLAAKTTYYLNVKCVSGTTVALYNANGPCVIHAICAYL